MLKFIKLLIGYDRETSDVTFIYCYFYHTESENFRNFFGSDTRNDDDAFSPVVRCKDRNIYCCGVDFRSNLKTLIVILCPGDDSSGQGTRCVDERVDPKTLFVTLFSVFTGTT